MTFLARMPTMMQNSRSREVVSSRHGADWRGRAFSERTSRGDNRLDHATTDEAEWAGLVERVAVDGDRAAFTGLFNHFAPRVKAYLLHHGVDEAGAEARAMEVMVAIWRRAASFEPERISVYTWVFRLMRNGGDDRPCRDYRGA